MTSRFTEELHRHMQEEIEQLIAEENMKSSKSELDSEVGFLIGNPRIFVGLEPPAESEVL